MDGRTQPNAGGDGLPIDPDAARNRPDAAVLAVVALGGMLGASARYGVDRWIPTPPGGFPWATFWVNASGSFLLGVLLVVIVERLRPTRLLRPFLAAGVLGAFTTMSTYQVETALLLEDGRVATAALYSVGSLVVGIGVAYLGLLAGRHGRFGSRA
jgi:CrcB protein